MVTRIQVARWAELDRDQVFLIVKLRAEVFYVEQRIDVPDLDELDRAPGTEHYFIHNGGDEVAAYLRFIQLPAAEHGATASFGRVAVAQHHRQRGLASALVAEVLRRHGIEPLVIHSQLYVAELYEKFGFQRVGGVFDEAGIPHITMTRPGD